MEEGSAPAKSSSKKPVILAVIIALLLAGGVGYYFYNKNQDEQEAKKAAAAQAVANNQTTTTRKAVFAPATTEGVPFVATVKTTTGDKATTGVMSSDGQGNVKYAYNNGGTEVSLIYTADAYYLCNGTATCLKYAATQSGSSGFDPSSYQYDGSRLNALKGSSNYKGQQGCPAPATGTCDVWSVTNGGATSTMYINTDTKRIAKVTTVTGSTSSEITYEYKNVTVAAPTNFTTVPTTGQ